MRTTRKFGQVVFAVIIIIAQAFSSLSAPYALAQGGDGLKRQYNAESGKVSFIGPESGRVLSASKALGTFIRPQDPAMALAKRFGPEFGLKNPERDLTEMKASRLENGRVIVRYQQKYKGIPVMGGELIVNTNERGDLYSMSGEVSSNLSLQTQPEIAPEQARDAALAALAKWYQTRPTDFVASVPELWIFDESLLQPSTRPVELVWRMEVTAVDASMPVRELVLVNAHRGSISLHFNQVDTAWADFSDSTIQLTGDYSPHLVASSWYVATTGNDTNDCTTKSTPCATINGAIGKAAAGDTIYVATGTYTGNGTEVVLIDNDVTISGGWNTSFSTQNGTTVIDGQLERPCITINTSTPVVIIEYFTIQGGYFSGVRNWGNLTINNSVIRKNIGEYQGGGILNYGTLTINNTTIDNNIVGKVNSGGGGGGAGIYSSYGPVVLNNTTVSNNEILGSFSGSGINNSGNLTLNNSTVSGNSGAEGISHNYGTLTLKNSTVTRNVGTYIGGIGNSYSQVILQNSLVAGNWGTNAPDCNEATSIGYNLIGINTYTFVGGVNGNEVFTDSCLTPTTGDLVGTSFSSISPRLNSLRDNGGATFTHALSSSSPAIDAGNPATCLPTDQRGVARPDGTSCDIGAYEGSVPWVPTPYVTTYTSNNTSSLPGAFLCNQTQPNCTNGSNPHADAAHKYAIGTYNLYANQHLRDSIDNNGMIIKSSVHYKSGYANAFWNGTQMIYGDAHGYPLADDVVAHELTHGITEYESNLFYYYQSGAISESLSDLWGEYYDRANGLGNDAVGVKWLLGENISGLGAIRNMKNPPAFGDPDKMSSPYYYEGAGDNGGVHHNSGVNNKAIFLMVDGGTFNGKTVTALGWSKTAAIYYEANANLLSSGADYSDLYYALQQACTNLIGQKGIISGDCAEVKDAVDAVQMNGQPAPNFNTDAPFCPVAGTLPSITFADDLESGSSNWTFTNGAYTRWQYDSPWGQYAQSGDHFLYADDYPGAVTDARAQLVSFVVPSNGYLHFAHAYDFEADIVYWDGGVLEYSTNGGSTWVDAGSLIDYNGYKGTIFNGAGNPLSSRSAFVGNSHGYISTRLNLASLAGQTVTFRWRMGLDVAVSAWGWWLDNIKVYKCLPVVSSVTRMDLNPTNAGSVDFEVIFSKAVTGVDTSDFSLDTSGVTGASISSVTATADAAVYTVTVDTGSGSGSLRLAVLNDGSIMDGSGNPLASGYTAGEAYTIIKTAGVGVGVYDDADANWSYTGAWVTYSGSVPYANNTVHYTTGAEDATASFMVSGTQFVLTYTQAPSRGVIEVYVDGNQVGTINANGALEFQKSYTSPVFPLGTHFVQFKHAGGGTYIDVDAIEVLTTAAPGAGVYDDAHFNWSYSAGWAGFSGSGPYDKTLHYSNVVDGAASFTFNGTQFVLTYTQAPNRGDMDVYLDGSRIATVNATGVLGWQQVYISPVFSSGTHFVQLKHADGGAYVDVDAIQILETAAPGVGVYDDADANWSYTDAWVAYSGGVPYANNTVHYTTGVGDTAAFTFSGSQFVLTYTQAANRGNIDVYVDGIQIATVNATGALAFEQTYISPVFSSETHVVQFKHAGGGGAFIDVDEIEILNTAAPGVGVYDDADANWSYSAGWALYNGSGPSGDTMHYTNTVGDTATFTFSGTQFVLTYTQAPNRGNIGVFVDGIQVATVNATGALAFEQTYTSPVFASGTHLVQFKHAGGGGAFIDVDAIEILNTSVPGTGVYDDADANWSYTAGWTSFTGSGPSGNTLHYTNAVGSTAAFTFSGTQFDLTYTQAANRGDIGVFVDGIKMATINATGALGWQQSYTSPVFTSGTHVVQFKHAGGGGAYIDVDAIEVP